jgi:hypothetical protein
MILSEDVQVQLFRQTAVGADPITPNGILVPRGSDFELPFMQKLLKNEQVQSDGFQRQSGKGNKTAEGGGGKIVANLNFLPYLLKAWCGQNVITGTGPYTHVARPNRTTLYYMYELGLIPLALFYKYYDQVTSELHFQLQTEGMYTVQQKLVGSGNVVFAGVTSLDTTPTELVGTTVDLTALTILENATDAGDTISMTIDCVSNPKQKRPTGAGAVAKEIKQGEKTVSGKVKFWFESDLRWARVRTGTLTALKGTVIDADGNSVEHYMPEVELESVGPKINDSEGVTQEYTFNAIRKANFTDTPIKFTTICTTAAVD